MSRIPPAAARSGERFDYPWVADQGDGTYRNPVLYADCPDPDVIRDGDDYFMVCSSFVSTPGLPIYHSRDLVNWTLVNHAVCNLPHARYEQVHPGCGIWAPAIRKHDGRFWIFFAMPDEGIFWTAAADPRSTWSPPHLIQEGKGLIDPCPLWDEDGKAYLVHAYAASRAGIKNKLRVRPMAADGSRLLDEGQIVFEDAVNHPTLEGPKFLKHEGYYYILAPAGGVETGWQLALRSRHIYGPYQEKIILEQGATPINGPHQGGLIDTPDGQWWFIHFQDTKPYGRIPHLQPARWEHGWPMIGVDHDRNGIGEPVLHHGKPRVGQKMGPQAHESNDEFDLPSLGLAWHWNANHCREWYSLSERPGWLRLVPQQLMGVHHAGGGSPAIDLVHTPSAMLQKFPARAFTVETKLDLQMRAPGQCAGLCVIGREAAGLAVEAAADGDHLRVHQLINGVVVATANVARAPLVLRIDVADGGLCTFSYRCQHNGFHTFTTEFQAVEGYWVGAKVGLFALDAGSGQGTSGFADFDYFRFRAPDTAGI